MSRYNSETSKRYTELGGEKTATTSDDVRLKDSQRQVSTTQGELP